MHRTGHGQQEKIFRNVRDNSIKNMDPSVWDRHVKQIIKTLCDKFSAMIREQGDIDRENTVSTGMAEERTETDQLLDDSSTIRILKKSCAKRRRMNKLHRKPDFSK